MSENNENVKVETPKNEKVKDNHCSSTGAVVGSVFFLIGIAIVFVLGLCGFLYLITK